MALKKLPVVAVVGSLLAGCWCNFHREFVIRRPLGALAANGATVSFVDGARAFVNSRGLRDHWIFNAYCLQLRSLSSAVRIPHIFACDFTVLAQSEAVRRICLHMFCIDGMFRCVLDGTVRGPGFGAIRVRGWSDVIRARGF